MVHPAASLAMIIVTRLVLAGGLLALLAIAARRR